MPHTRAELSETHYKTLQSLKRVSFDEVRHSKISDACPDTLQWFFDDKEFKSWRDSSEASSFWIHGAPGQGKSVLAKFLTKHLEEHFKNLQAERVAVINFFCYRQEEHFRKPTDILRALILQLIDCEELFEYLPSYFQTDPSEFFAAPLSSLWELFSTIALDSRHQRVYCVIDAFDECFEDGDQRADLLRRLVKLFSSKQRQMKLLVTSRPAEKDIEHNLHDVAGQSLHARPEDLNLYIESKIKDLPSYSFNDQLKKASQGYCLCTSRRHVSLGFHCHEASR